MTMTPLYALLLIGASCLQSLDARLTSSSNSNSNSNSNSEGEVVDVREDVTSFPPRRLQYSEDESRYMVWDFSERANPIKVPGERVDELFGSAVSIWDQYMVIGASGDRSRQFASGAIYMYDKQVYGDGTYYWELLEVLEPWDGQEGDNFGIAVDLHLYTMVVGSNMNDENGQDAGAAYIYECYNNAEHHQDEHHHEDQTDQEMQRMWYLAAKLLPEDGLPQDYFGSSVATQGNSTIVGAYGNDYMATFSGSVYVWRKTWTLMDPHHPWEWVYDEMIVASDGQRYDFFGTSLAVYGKTLAIGATGVDEDEMYKVGAVYVYLNTYDDSAEDGLSYQLLKKLTPGALGVTYENFGQSVAMWGYNLVVGAPNSNASGVEAAGAFYSYGFDTYNQPYFLQKVLPAFPSPSAHCGYSIDIYQDLAAMGCPNASGYGSIYIYTEVTPFNTPSTKNVHWLFESRKSVADKWSGGDMFGHAVSVYDDTVAVGAYKSLSSVGAAYMYIGRKKIYQDLFENETDDTEEIIVEEEEVEEETIEEILLAFEEAHPRETKMIVLVLFLLVLTAVSFHNKRKNDALLALSTSARKSQSYELATMDSSHGSVSTAGSNNGGSNRNDLSFGSPPDSSRGASTYTPITTSETKGSSQRVKDLAAAGLLSKPTQKYTPLASPVFSPLSINRSASSSLSSPSSPEAGQ